MQRVDASETVSEEDILFVLNNLTTLESPKFVFSDLESHPTGDVRVRDSLKGLLHNDTPCVVSIPFYFSEIRYLAARALASERYRSGNPEPVHLCGVVAPVASNSLALLAHRESLHTPSSSIEGQLEDFILLRERDLLPRYDMDIVVRNGFVELIDHRQVNQAVLPGDNWSY